MNNNKIFITINLLWAFCLMAIGIWWLYLLNTMNNVLKVAKLTEAMSGTNIVRLIKWEGSAFLILLALLSISLIILHITNQKKTKSLQTFFASLTHELKTPLASVRLQTEVINELTENTNNEKLKNLTSRLIEDTVNLENQMDKILQLSRIEMGGNLPLKSIDFNYFLDELTSKYKNDLNIKVDSNLPETSVIADHFSLELIFKNLLENTKVHTQQKNISITIREKNEFISIKYSDSGSFKGDSQKLGQLFYRSTTLKGSGIGLYIIKNLVKLMNGTTKFNTTDGFNVLIQLPKGEESE